MHIGRPPFTEATTLQKVQFKNYGLKLWLRLENYFLIADMFIQDGTTYTFKTNSPLYTRELQTVKTRFLILPNMFYFRSYIYDVYKLNS